MALQQGVLPAHSGGAHEAEDAAGAAGSPHAEARIGPNAVTRLAEALQALEGAAARDAVFRRAGLAEHLRAPPTHMVAELDVVRLHQALFERLGAQRSRVVARDAGARTGAYLLAHRIPAPVRGLLRALPAPLASRVLATAIARHAWTFAGSAAFTARGRRPVSFTLAGCPVCRAVRAADASCDFYTGCFETLYRALVHRRASVIESACAGRGAPACRFEVRW